MKVMNDFQRNQRLDERVNNYNEHVLNHVITHQSAIDYSEYIGKVYNWLTVREYVGSDRRSAPWFRCECKCGRSVIKPLVDIKSGNTKSCGCMHVEHAVNNGKLSTKHGLSDSKLYNIYRGMCKRCYNPKHKSYPDYGGRGIKICDEWLNDSTLFFTWAIDHGYKSGLTIERINSNGNYSSNNCRWASSKEQANNRRSNMLVTIGFSTYTVKEWCEILNVNPNNIYARIYRGWKPEDALLTPTDGKYFKPAPVNKIIFIPPEYAHLNKYEVYKKEGL